MAVAAALCRSDHPWHADQSVSGGKQFMDARCYQEFMRSFACAHAGMERRCWPIA